ncbi:uncharacterized protein N7498_000935 [Penicillium cinerascens]|uniref:Hydrophobin n=1 Tax=Penicillium cinerascens TaxID=70096 RepID=A0A9W9NFA1_9EURO|nr:uncharacterized protein N7498_000935 [Penicillium cinerascens]KAJ5218836.1 hypothetical protein N7498_000935 [Penicillium cinerascens]
MKAFAILLSFAAVVLALPSKPCATCGGHQETGNVCGSKQTVVCQGEGNAGLVTLGNVLEGALGESCSAGDVYCCEEGDIQQSGLVNLNLNAQCSLNRVL